MRHCRLRQSGFTLLGLLTVMSMLGVFMGVASQLFIASIRATRDAGRLVTQTTMMENAFARLRLDAASAATITVDSDTQVTLAAPDTGGAVWTIDPAGELSRRPLAAEGGQGEQRWPLPFESMRFQREGPALLLHIKADGREQAVPFTGDLLRAKALEKAMVKAGTVQP